MEASLLFVNGTKIYQLNAKDSEIKDYTFCFSNISNDFTISCMKKYSIKRNGKKFLW